MVCLLKAEGGGGRRELSEVVSRRNRRRKGGGKKEQSVDVLIRKRVRPRLLFEKVEYMMTRIRVETLVKS